MTMFRISEAAQLLGVSADTVRRWVDADRLPATRQTNGHRVIAGADLAAFVRGQYEEPASICAISSARNRLRGIVTAVATDTVMAQVDIQAGPFRVVSLMSREALEDLDLRVGSMATAVIKSTNVVVERDELAGLSRKDSPMRRASVMVTALAVTSAGLLGCGASGEGEGTELHVFAAASLTESFEVIGEAFEEDNPGVEVVFNFEGSSTLATQINEGAPADVFASAAPANMDTVVAAGNAVGDPEVFIRNELVIAVPSDNPHDIAALRDLTDDDLKVAMCAEDVPCGAAATAAMEAGDVEFDPVSVEKDVKGALSKLTLDEVDAALVYRSDVEGADDATGLEFPESAEAINDYPIAVCDNAANLTSAENFVEFVRAPESQEVLSQAGFLEV